VVCDDDADDDDADDDDADDDDADDDADCELPVWLEPARRAAGVPALAAQPGRRGPTAVQTLPVITATTLVTPTATRTPDRAGQPTAKRHAPVATTAATHPTTRARTQSMRGSVPVPSEWTTASGQLT
jgi:hypothetical protein